MWVWKTASESPRGTVVIVHGAGEHHGRYDWFRKKWLKEGFHVVTGDLPGQGKTKGKRGHIDTFDDYIEAVSAWLDRAFAFGLPVLLFGHSLGGLSVIRTLQETSYKPRLVVLSSPCLGLVVPPPEWVKKVARPFNKWTPTLRIPIKRSADNKMATRNEAILNRDRSDPLIVKSVSIRWYFELEQAMKQGTLRIENFPDVPLIILQAGADKIVDKRAVHQFFRKVPLKNKLYKEWPGFYHEIINEPEREQVFRFLLNKSNPYFKDEN